MHVLCRATGTAPVGQALAGATFTTNLLTVYIKLKSLSQNYLGYFNYLTRHGIQLLQVFVNDIFNSCL